MKVSSSSCEVFRFLLVERLRNAVPRGYKVFNSLILLNKLRGFPSYIILQYHLFPRRWRSPPSQEPSFGAFSRPSSSSHGSELTLIKPLRLSRRTRTRDAFKDMVEKVSSQCEITRAVFLIILFPDLTCLPSLPPHQPVLVQLLMGPSKMLLVFGLATTALPLTRMDQSKIGTLA
jgi:hypothetical protein